MGNEAKNAYFWSLQRRLQRGPLTSRGGAIGCATRFARRYSLRWALLAPLDVARFARQYTAAVQYTA